MIEIRPRLLAWAAVTGWVVALTGVLLSPIIGSGYLLGHDMVFTPRQPLGLASIGVSSVSPRAVPVDALVALAERLVDGAVVGRLAVVLPLLAAGIGMAALVRAAPLPARVAAGGAAIWNPFVVERLALGQWALLWAYAALPWIVVVAGRARDRFGWAALAVALAAGSITPTGGVIVAVAAVVVAAASRPRRQVTAVAAIAAMVQLPWLIPALTTTASATSDPSGVAAFAARAERPGGALLSLLDGGGIWDAEVVPGTRGGVLPWVWLVVLAAAAVFGRRLLVDVLGRRVVLSLVVLAAAGLLIAALPSLPGGGAVVRAAVAHVPGAGLLRDAQKWVLPLVVLEVALLGCAAARVFRAIRTAPVRSVAVVAVLLLPILVLPDGPATLRPTFRPVHYPGDWAEVGRLVDSAGGDVAVVPWGSYRRFAWVHASSVLDPAPRLLPAPTVVDDRLAVSGRLLQGEDQRAARVGAALRAGGQLDRRLAAQGIRWVVVEHGTPGAVPPLTGLRTVHAGRDVSLYEVRGPVRADRPATGRVAVVVGADVAVLLGLLGLLGWGAFRRLRRRASPSPNEGAGRGSLLE